jgi:Signal recognition particle 14kD protein
LLGFDAVAPVVTLHRKLRLWRNEAKGKVINRLELIVFKSMNKTPRLRLNADTPFLSFLFPFHHVRVTVESKKSLSRTMPPHRENGPFLDDLTDLMRAAKTGEGRSVWLTIKRLTHEPSPVGPVGGGVSKARNIPGKRRFSGPKGGAAAKKADKAPAEPLCLVRATDGKKVKISTIVAQKDVPSFQKQYANILRAEADALKRKQRRKRSQKRA